MRVRSRCQICLQRAAMTSVEDRYHFDTDPDLGSEKVHYRSGSGSRANFATDPDPGKNDTIWIQQKEAKYQENL